MNIEQAYKKLESGFLGFWVKNWRISFLVMALIIGMGALALIGIPKESSPNIKFGIIQVTTIYPGVNPVDMDSLVTDEIEQAVKDIDWITKIESTSQVGAAFTTLTLDNDADTREILNDLRAEVDKVNLPSDAEEPSITEISADTELMFQVSLFGDKGTRPKERLKNLAQVAKDRLEGKYGIDTIDIQWWSEFDLQVLVDQNKAEVLWIDLQQIAWAIRSYNANTPLGSFEIDSLNYDFRIDGELVDEQDLLDVPLTEFLKLRDVATIDRDYNDESVRTFGRHQESWYNVATMSVNKDEWWNIFELSDGAKTAIEELLESPEFDWVQFLYGQDLAELIKTDYKDLARSWLLTLVWVFLCLLLFVWLKEALIATFAIPLAFMVTFIVLQQIDLSLNFLTNFSLVLTLWIAIDTTIVIIEAAYENLKLWYNPKTAVLKAVKDFSAPLIAGTSTTLVVFIPMMVLPGITGKFLAYIPITVFITLIAALFISLTVNSAFFYKLSKAKKWFIPEETAEKFLSETDLAILALERQGKEARWHENKSLRHRMLWAFSNRYERTLRSFLSSKVSRLLSVFVPIILLVISFITLAPRIWFTLFPGSDNGFFFLEVENVPGASTADTAQYLPFVEAELSQIPELDQYNLSVNGNRIDATIELTDLADREAAGLRDVFEVEQDVLANLDYLTNEWLVIESVVDEWWPPQEKPVGIKLVTDDNSKFSQLIQVAKDFQAQLRTIEGTKNVAISSKDTPGQFIFAFDRQKLASLGLTPGEVSSQLSIALNGANAWSITLNSVDADIKVLYNSFSDQVSPSDITNTQIITPNWLIPVSEVLDYSVDNAVWAISRADTKVTIKVDADLEEEFARLAAVKQTAFADRAAEYNFPEGIDFDAAWESDENAELIQAAIRGFAIALFLMLVILVLQFNSFSKPVIILYSVLLALLWVNIWLRVTGNPYSMSFAIWFIALMGIVVNDAIIFIDKINKNLDHGVDTFESIIEAGRSRLQPIVLTTLTTLLWVLPIALQDPFWAWLWFTMIFWLFAGSAMTLFVIPSLYYMVFVKRTGEKKKRFARFRRLFRDRKSAV